METQFLLIIFLSISNIYSYLANRDVHLICVCQYAGVTGAEGFYAAGAHGEVHGGEGRSGRGRSPISDQVRGITALKLNV